ncbi:FMN-dependent NADH-azoreductase [Marinitenerispora sediminis]|uniref:FMN dependent NADH:quinone oxidoreductase n=2 Tax=Marinitenerispora sediminis TaxID=1931232 RepID=A0A368T0W2_9ACTN|nr:NAD(P)H-dependent oxidoreductase [Marinitenerispora sediminis]RCV49544.1 FMN-dependent NADH-azoreductase [Marinitenerispora sediminis]RCV53279.1 FMN-dependent NADH-azoreductase [Marinitenerispora sediminis]
MPHLLHIDSSSLAEGSVSRDVAASFRAVWQEAEPNGRVTYRDLAAHPLPHIDHAGVTARTTPRELHTPRQREAMELQDLLIGELEAADAYLFSVPMYNWSVPSAFKAWVDQVLVAGRTASLTGDPLEGPLSGRPAIVIAPRGGSYAPGTPQYRNDFVVPFLEKLFAQTIGLDLRIITPELTLAAVNPAMHHLREPAETSLAHAHAAAEEHALSLAERLRGP